MCPREKDREKDEVFVTEVPVERYGSAYGKKRRNKMEVVEVKLRDEYIKLGQALKATGMVESGVEAKEVIQEGLVMVNGETDTRRGRKLYGGDVVLFDGEEIRIEG